MKIKYYFAIIFCLANSCLAFSGDTSIAVNNLDKRNLSLEESYTISDFLREGFVKAGKYSVIERTNMEQIFAEHKFQMTGCTSDSCAVKMGQILNAQKVVVGSVSKLGDDYYINIRLVNVENGQIEIADSEKTAYYDELPTACFMLAYRMSGIKYFEAKKERKASEEVQSEPQSIISKYGSEMVLISTTSEFLMGSPANEGRQDEHPRHKVYLNGYYIDRYEVTNEQYANFLNIYGRDKDESGNAMVERDMWGIKRSQGKWASAIGYEKFPVICVTWYGAVQYAKFYGKRLPTEAEWENACRAGSDTKYFWGAEGKELDNYAWNINNSGNKTHPFGMKKTNALGLNDFYGNVTEWVSDWYDERYYEKCVSPNPKIYADTIAYNPTGPATGKYKVVRGGFWFSGANNCRSASREYYPPNIKRNFIGFRCVVSASELKTDH